MLAVIIAWFATFTIIWVFITVGLGFGHIGVGAGTFIRRDLDTRTLLGAWKSRIDRLEFV